MFSRRWKKMNESSFGKYLSLYFLRYIPSRMDYSENTIKAYRDTFTIFLRYCSEVLNLKPEKLKIVDMNKDFIEDFLNWLINEKKYSIRTRNQRLAALHSYFRFLQIEAPEYLDVCNSILSIKAKKVADTEQMTYLSIKAIQKLLATPNSKIKEGKRDLALLTLLYDTGARVQEIIDLTISDLKLSSPATVRLLGKGQKVRIIPITPQTVSIMRVYMDNYQLTDEENLMIPIFFNKQKGKLSRPGVTYILKKHFEKARKNNSNLFPSKISPHALRHSKAMHLLEANVNLIYIRDFLGHVSVSTTEIYAKSNPEIKRKAIEAASKNVLPDEVLTMNDKEVLLDWLREFI